MPTSAVTMPMARKRLRNSLLPVGGRAVFPEIYFVKQIDNSRLCREVDPEKRRECFCFLALGILTFFLGLLLAWQHLQCVRFGYQIEELKAHRAGLEEWNHQLQLLQASLADPHRIDILARQQLGMRSVGPEQVVRVKPAVPDASGGLEFAHNFPALGGIFREP